MNFSSVSRNIIVIKQSLKAVIGNTGYFVKVLCLIVILGYFLSYIDSATDVLSVTPGYILPPKFWIWTAFTHCFLEIRLWQVIVDIVTLVLCGKLIEPLWGSYEMVFFFLLVNMCVAFISAFFYLIIYMFTSNTEVLFEVHIQGMAGYIAGLSVAVKQVMPDHIILHTRTPLGKILNRHVPLLLFVTSCLLYVCKILEGLYATMIGCGIAVSWVYLRFYQIHASGSRGDFAESFQFASFFPTVLQPPIQVISDGFFRCLVKLKLCRKTVRKYDVGAPTSISISLPGMDPNDAERRRQKALKLLSDRLNQQQDMSISWPTDELNESNAPLLPHSSSISPPSSLHTKNEPSVSTHSASTNKNLEVDQSESQSFNIQSSSLPTDNLNIIDSSVTHASNSNITATTDEAKTPTLIDLGGGEVNSSGVSNV